MTEINSLPLDASEPFSQALDTESLAQSVADKAVEIKDKAQKNIDIEFLYNTHETEYRDKIVEMVQDKDVVLLEALFPDEQTRLDQQAYVDQALRRDGDPREQAITRSILEQAEQDGDIHYHERIIKAFIGTGKIIKYIDVDFDDPEFQPLESELSMAEMRYAQSLARFEEPEKTKKYLVNRVNLLGRQSIYREEKVKKQIDTMLKTLARNNKPYKVAVVYGASHTEPYHHLAADADVAVSRKFITDGDFLDDATQTFTYSDELIRDVRFFPDRELADSKLERALLEYQSNRLLEHDNQASTGPRKWIAHLSDAQVAEALNVIYEIANKPKHVGRELVEMTAEEKAEAVRQYLLKLATARSED